MFEGLTNFANLSNHLVLIGIFMILALSLNLINGSLGAFSLGHNAFWGMGAYTAGIVVWTMGSADGSLGPFVLSFVCAIATASLFGLLVGVPCLRLKGDYLAIATLGFAEIFIIFARNSEGWKNLFAEPAPQPDGSVDTVHGILAERGLGGAAGFSLGDGFHGGNDFVLSLMGDDVVKRNVFYLVLTWVLVAVTFVVIRNLLRSTHGRAILAVREDETAAELLGVNLTRYKVLAFVTGAAFAGLAGALYANFMSNVSPNYFVLMQGIKILLMVVLGGLGSMSGTLVAVVVLYSTEQALTNIQMQVPFPYYNEDQASFGLASVKLKDLWQVIFSVLLVLLMLMRPEGFMGRQEFSRAYFQKLRRRWIAQPLMPALTVVQGVQLLLVLSLSTSPWILLVSLAALVGIQAFKSRTARQSSVRALAEGSA